jgi:hypothetical protein
MERETRNILNVKKSQIIYDMIVSGKIIIIIIIIIIISWFRHYATSLKDAGSIPDEIIGFFNLPNSSSRTMALESTQPLTEMSTRNIPGRKGWPAHKADNLTAVCLKNVGASTSHNPMGLHGLLQG